MQRIATQLLAGCRLLAESQKTLPSSAVLHTMNTNTPFLPPTFFAASMQSNCNFHHSCQSKSEASSSHNSHETISITFVEKDGKEVAVKAPLGKNLLEVAHENDVDLEGACEASLACSTCHLIVESEDYFKKIPEATEDELDMLDLAFGLTETSRLGCQVITSKALDGIKVRIPAATRNFYVDGAKPAKH